MLDGVYVDIVGDVVLPATARVRRPGVRQGHGPVHARLAGHGGVFGDALHTGSGTQPDYYFVHVRVHIRGHQAATTGFPGARQGTPTQPIETSLAAVTFTGFWEPGQAGAQLFRTGGT